MEKFKPIKNEQLFLLPPSITDFIPESHLARIINEIVDTIDVSEIENKYSILGQKSYSPRLLLKLLFYAYSTGTRSGRKIAACCEQDTAFMYLASMYKPDFRTINDFRKNNTSFIQKSFLHIVQICRELGMCKAGMLILDGSKLKANANASLTKTKQQYEQWLKQIEEDIKLILDQAAQEDTDEDQRYGTTRGDELPKELQSKQKLKSKIIKALSQIKEDEKLNLTDQDAKYIKGKGGIDLNYNCQAAITEDGIIVGAYASNNCSDRPETIRAVENAEEVSGIKFVQILADSGYASYDNYEHLSKEGKDIYIPDQQMNNEKEMEKNPYHRNHFIYQNDQDCLVCPEGKKLLFNSFYDDKRTKQKSKIYKCNACPDCEKQKICTKGKYRQIYIELREPLREKIRDKLKTIDGKAQYLKRMRIESIFGNIKHNLNYTHLYLKGLEKVTAEWQLICIGHNLKKIHKRKAA